MWAAEEVQQAQAIVRQIEACPVPRRRARLTRDLELRLSDAIPLRKGLAGSSRALLIRQLFRALGFDEHRHAGWRLEHKLVQALVLNHWCPGAAPVTSGLDFQIDATRRFTPVPGSCLLFPHEFVIKETLGDSSGEREGESLTDAVLASISRAKRRARPAASVTEEKYIVQERIEIAHEYRVHSLEDRVIPSLTTRRYGEGTVVTERDAPNAFVQSLLDRLPNGFVGGSLLGWDVAKTRNGGFRVIEANISGYHTVHRPGFHCSGYFHDALSGAGNTARLLTYVAAADGVSVIVLADSRTYRKDNRFYADVAASTSSSSSFHLTVR